MIKVVVYDANPEDPGLLARLGKNIQVVFEPRALDEDNFHSGANVIVISTKCCIELRHITPSLKAIVSRTTGINHIKCLDELKKLEIPVLQPKGYATQSVAEYSLHAISRELSDGYFVSSGIHEKAEIAAHKFVIVGAGAIGRRLHELLGAIGGSSVLVSSSESNDTHPYADLGELIAEADFICLHASLKEDNKKLINNDLLFKVKSGAVLINAARGEMIDNQALLFALNKGKISKAYLDLVADDMHRQELVDHSKVVFTNHTAWKTEAALRKSQDFLISTLENLATS